MRRHCVVAEPLIPSLKAALMVTDQLDLLPSPSTNGFASHPMDSSRVLLALIDLAKQGEEVEREDPDSLDSVVARPVLRRLLSALHFRMSGR